jgi:hypothetical protein
LKRFEYNQYIYKVESFPGNNSFPIYDSEDVVAGSNMVTRLGWGEKTEDAPVNMMLAQGKLLSVNRLGNSVIESEKITNLTSFGFTGDEAFQVQITTKDELYWSVFLQHLMEILKDYGIDAELPVAFIAELEQVQLEGSVITPDGKRLYSDDFFTDRLSVTGFFFEEPDHINRENRSLRMLSECLKKFPAGGTVKSIAWGKTNDNQLRFIEPESTFKVAKTQVFLLFEELGTEKA